MCVGVVFWFDYYACRELVTIAVAAGGVLAVN